jgi:hypothetical protein
MSGAAKRAYNRLLRPYAAYQHEINATTSRGLEEIRAELAELRATLAAVLELDVASHGRLTGAEERLRLLAAEQARQRDRLEGSEDPA